MKAHSAATHQEAANPSIEGTVKRLRLLPAPHVKRYAPIIRNEGKYGTIEVARFAFKTGNTDGSGNYSIVQFKLGEERVEFNNSSGAWAHKLTTP